MKVFDLHCDTLSELRRAEMRGDGQTFARNNGHIDLEKLEKGDYMLQCFAAFVNLADPTPGADPLVTALEEIDVFKRMMEQYSDRIAPVYRPEDIRKNAEAGKISGMLTIEEGGCCKGSLGVLRRMYELGVRMMTLTWNHENELASPNVVPGNGPIWPCMPNTETGLKEKGFEFLAEMERLHIIADVSHLSDKGFWDIAEHSTRPFAASHSNCRALAPHCRNLTDEMIRVMAEKGGLVGLNYCAGFLDDQPSPDLCRSTTGNPFRIVRYPPLCIFHRGMFSLFLRLLCPLLDLYAGMFHMLCYCRCLVDCFNILSGYACFDFRCHWHDLLFYLSRLLIFSYCSTHYLACFFISYSHNCYLSFPDKILSVLTMYALKSTIIPRKSSL